ncbi:hypothetical protein EDD18DRAFT_1358677 [Armillaria luteobubalina]|uniref:Uncharacterized protein n=1 Tax=Armillaria luteobubalina TaxID=153913 RepID=A0AA39UJB6_9AGAR|nr:hypothetical protein EDD18DRAFT_1358677 [Armillaria luteobubalina]
MSAISTALIPPHWPWLKGEFSGIPCAGVAMLETSTLDVATSSIFLKKLFDVKTGTASSASFIPGAANRQFVCVPVGNIIVSPSSTPPTSKDIVLHVTK